MVFTSIPSTCLFHRHIKQVNFVVIVIPSFTLHPCSLFSIHVRHRFINKACEFMMNTTPPHDTRIEYVNFSDTFSGRNQQSLAADYLNKKLCAPSIIPGVCQSSLGSFISAVCIMAAPLLL